MSLPRYAAYKLSGVEWLEQLPATWTMKRLKYVANRSEVKVEADEDTPLPYIGLEHVESWTGRLLPLDEELVPTGISNYFKSGDTLFGKLRPYLAKACNVDFEGLCSSELLVLRGKSYEPRFLLYQLLSQDFINLVDSSTYGSKMPRASWDFIGSCELPLPPLEEQHTIANFLDAQTAKIDTLLAKKRQFIAKLKEKRSALIARTVTRGLPPATAKAAGLEPHSAMKDSGVEWLDDVPVHWEVKPLKHVAHRSEVKVEADEDNPMPYVGLEHVESWTGRLLPLDEELVPTGISNYFKNGDTLFGKLRPYLAKACNVDFEGLCSSELLVLRGKKYDRQFLLYQLLTDGFINLIDSSTYGSKMPRASWDFIGMCELAFPPIDEQRAIAAYLDRETARIDQLTAKVETAIARLAEYRQALVTAAVTGKIDVRNNARLKEVA